MGTKGDNNRQRIVSAADKLFYVRGYNQTSFRDISEQTGIPRGNFYYYFKSKDDILDAVVDARVKTYRNLLEQCMQESNDPRGRLLAFADLLGVHEDKVMEVGCPIGSLVTELAKDADELHKKSLEVFELMRSWLNQQFSELGIQNPNERAMDMLSRMQGVTVIGSAFKDREFMRRNMNEIKSWINSLALS